MGASKGRASSISCEQPARYQSWRKRAWRRHTVQQWQLPSNQPRILPQFSVVLQLSVSVTRQIIAVVILIRSQFLFSLGPKPRAPLLLLYLKVLVVLELEVIGEGNALFAFADGVRNHIWVEVPKILDKFAQLLCGFRFGRRCVSSLL